MPNKQTNKQTNKIFLITFILSMAFVLPNCVNAENTGGLNCYQIDQVIPPDYCKTGEYKEYIATQQPCYFVFPCSMLIRQKIEYLFNGGDDPTAVRVGTGESTGWEHPTGYDHNGNNEIDVHDLIFEIKQLYRLTQPQAIRVAEIQKNAQIKYLVGDVNFNGITDSTDVSQLTAFVNKSIKTLGCQKAGDLNRDGVLTGGDVTLLTNAIATKSLPTEKRDDTLMPNELTCGPTIASLLAAATPAPQPTSSPTPISSPSGN